MSQHRIDERRGRNPRISIFALLLLFSAIPLSAQQDSSRNETAESRSAETAAADSAAEQAIRQRIQRSSIRQSLLLQPAIVFRRGDERAAGFLLDVIEDSIYLRSRNEILRVPIGDVTKLSLPLTGSSFQVGTHGALIGTYMINVVMMTDETRPGTYANVGRMEPAGFALANLGSLALFYALLSLFEHDNTEAMQFDFTADAEKRRSEEARFLAFTHGAKTDAKLHLTVQLSDVRPTENDRPNRLIREAGRIPDYPPHWSSVPRYEGSFNLFRKGQITYSFQPGYTLGAAYMNLNEPKYTERAYVTTGGGTTTIQERQRLEGWYAVGTYEPMHEKWKGPFEWLFGIGLGVAVSSGKLTVGTLGDDYSNQVSVLHEQSLASSLFSTFAFTDLRLYLYRSLSLALTGEYVFVNPMPVESFGGITTSESTLNLSSWSWGLALGVHF